MAYKDNCALYNIQPKNIVTMDSNDIKWVFIDKKK